MSFPCEDWASEFTTYQNGSSRVQEASTIQVPVILVFDQGKWNVTSAEFFRSEYSERFKKIFAGADGSSSSSSGGSYSGTGVLDRGLICFHAMRAGRVSIQLIPAPPSPDLLALPSVCAGDDWRRNQFARPLCRANGSPC